MNYIKEDKQAHLSSLKRLLVILSADGPLASGNMKEQTMNTTDSEFPACLCASFPQRQILYPPAARLHSLMWTRIQALFLQRETHRRVCIDFVFLYFIIYVALLEELRSEEFHCHFYSVLKLLSIWWEHLSISKSLNLECNNCKCAVLFGVKYFFVIHSL